jgi:hypothetical protein
MATLKLMITKTSNIGEYKRVKYDCKEKSGKYVYSSAVLFMKTSYYI